MVLGRLVAFEKGAPVVSAGLVRFAHMLFALGIAGLGVLNVVHADFALQWQPVPKWVPGRSALAVAVGLFAVACCIGIFVKRYAGRFALALAAYLLVWLVLLKGPGVIAAPLEVVSWLGFCESLALLCGGWVLFAFLSGALAHNHAPGKLERTLRVARLLFGASCLVFGLAHFAYPGFTAAMVPAWLPYRVGFAYLTGAGHFAAGLGIVFMLLPRLAATLEALMISSFVALVHIPGVVAEPGSRLQWTMLCVACALAGAAWLMAAAFATTALGTPRK